MTAPLSLVVSALRRCQTCADRDPRATTDAALGETGLYLRQGRVEPPWRVGVSPGVCDRW